MRLPRLAATAFICLCFGMNTHAGATNTLWSIPSGPHLQRGGIAQKMQVLSGYDQDRYADIFAAQAKGDWQTADELMGDLRDRGLMGHVLAQRYEQRTPTSAELKQWLADYSDLPEASGIYKQLRHMSGSKAARMPRKAFSNLWSGGDSYEVSFGFRAETKTQPSAAARRLETKINHALQHGNPIGAEDLLFAEYKHRALSSTELGEDEGRIAAGFYYAGVTEYARKLAMEAATTGNPLALWISGLTAWKAGDKHAAADAFAKLAAHGGLSASDQAAASFWAARALKSIDEDRQANVFLVQAAHQPRTFYGLLANALIGQGTKQSWQMPSLTQANINTLKKTSAGWRALALIQIGQKDLAESELRHLNPQGQHDLQDAMLALAETAQMPSLALQIGGIATDNGKRYDAALYPLPPWQPEQGFQVDRALIYALMRHESRFNPTAVSERGACGLMQLMPATARLLVSDKISGTQCSGRMLEPVYNLTLGQKYVRRLGEQKMIGDNLVFLLAAYNSGPGKLQHWTDEGHIKDPLLFIESVPLHETRDYVQQVLMHYWSYRARLGQPGTSRLELAKGEWPRYSLHDEPAPAPGLKDAMANGFEVASSQR